MDQLLSSEMFQENWFRAIIWCLISGSALLIGSYFGIKDKFTHSWIARIMAFGSGSLLGLISIDMTLMAKQTTGTINTVIGLLLGASVFCLANWLLSKKGAKERKRCGECVEQKTEKDSSGSGLAIACGTMLDAIPEGLILGIDIAQNGKPGIATILGFFVSNFPESLSASTGMIKAKRSKKYINAIWLGAILMTIITSQLGVFLFPILPETYKGLIEAIAGGLLFAMVTETMIPEAFDHSPDFSGVLTVLGFSILALTAAQ
ncbi:MAG TPA: hypothetical protein VNJ01_08445 [Bacteriovoracaceae bacterium]|nr:hypothetical protein [Bacteriovoracaceae bacterium]